MMILLYSITMKDKRAVEKKEECNGKEEKAVLYSATDKVQPIRNKSNISSTQDIKDDNDFL